MSDDSRASALPLQANAAPAGARNVPLLGPGHHRVSLYMQCAGCLWLPLKARLSC